MLYMTLMMSSSCFCLSWIICRLCPGSHLAASSLQHHGETLPPTCAPWRPQHAPPATYTHTHAHTLTHICMHKHTHATLNWHRGLPTIAQESGCTLVHSTEEEVHHQECVCLCVREMAGGVKSGCLHHLGKVAASTSLLVTRKMWKHSLPPPYCWWSHGFTFLWHIIIFFFVINFDFTFCSFSIKTSITPAPLVRLLKGLEI